MAAQILELPKTFPLEPKDRAAAPVRPARASSIFFPAPLLHPHAVEALLLAFRPLAEQPGEGD